MVCVTAFVNYVFLDPDDDSFEFLNSVEANLVNMPENIELVEMDSFDSFDGEDENGLVLHGTANQFTIAYSYANLSETEVISRVVTDFKQTQFNFTEPVIGVTYYLVGATWEFYNLDEPNYEEDDDTIFQYEEEIFPNFRVVDGSDSRIGDELNIWEFDSDYKPTQVK